VTFNPWPPPSSVKKEKKKNSDNTQTRGKTHCQKLPNLRIDTLEKEKLETNLISKSNIQQYQTGEG
jgi:hypothetical protein